MKSNNEIYLKCDIFVGIKENTEEYGETTKITLYVGHDLLKCLKKLARYSSGQKGKWGIGEYLVLEQWRNGNKQSEYDLYDEHLERQYIDNIIKEYRQINKEELKKI